MTWRPSSRDDRTIAWLWAVSAVALLALRQVLVAAAALLPSCTWHAWTGIACPGCGTTRAMTHLLQLDPGGAVRFNPLATVAAGGFIALGIVAPVWIAAGAKVPVPDPGPKPRWLTLAVLAVLANWGWLVATGV